MPPSKNTHATNTLALAFCFDILPHVSRTFAIGIQSLAGEVKKSVLVGYLLCRILDTVEDEPQLSATQKTDYLQRFLLCFDDPSQALSYAAQIAPLISTNPDYQKLVGHTPSVFQVYAGLSLSAKQSIRHWVSEMATGMAQFINKYPQGIRIAHLAEYKQYCYYVAGTVGHLLTALWKHHGHCLSKRQMTTLSEHSGAFGQALQTVNILKDIYWDATHENAIYVPLDLLKKHGIPDHGEMLAPGYHRQSEKAVRELVSLAQADLAEAVVYVSNIPKINLRIRFFCVLPLLLAQATLKKLLRSGAFFRNSENIKVTRAEVKTLVWHSVFAALSNRWLKKQCSG